MKSKGILHIETLPEIGAQRFYAFQLEDHPELLEFTERYDEAKTRLFSRVCDVLKAEERKPR